MEEERQASGVFQAPSLGKAEGTATGLRLHWLREVWRSTIGKKFFVAITGAILGLYVILHVLGNLKALQGSGNGEAPVDTYAEWLRTVGGPAIPREGVLWSVRALLVAALVIHVVAIVQLTARNRAARPPGYRRARIVDRSLSARTMTITGVLILAFVVFHVLHLTTLTIEPTPLTEGTVYANMHGAFQEWWLVAIYVAAAVAVGYHLRHALWSMVQTMGWDKPNRNPTLRRGATGTAVLLLVGFALVPLLFWVGILPEPGGAGVAGVGEGIGR